jgi:hypothetical protein
VGLVFKVPQYAKPLLYQGFEVLSISRKKRTSNLFECGIAEVTDKESLIGCLSIIQSQQSSTWYHYWPHNHP